MLVFPRSRSGAARAAPLPAHGRMRGRAHLDRVAERGPRSVGFDVRHVARRDARASQRGLDDGPLRRSIRDREPAARAVWIHRESPHDREGAIPGGARGREALEHDGGASFATDVAVGRLVEGLARAVRGKHARLGERDARLRREQQVDPGHDRGRRFAALQAFARDVESHERGGARRVDRERGPGQAEHVRQPSRRGGVRVPGPPVGVHRVGPLRLRAREQVVDSTDRDEDARRRAVEPIGGEPGVLKRVPRALEEEALLRIESLRLARRDPEERRVEAVDVVEESASARADRPRSVGLAAMGRDVPAPRGDVAYGVHTLVEEAPERTDAVGARETHRHAHDPRVQARPRSRRARRRSPPRRLRARACLRGARRAPQTCWVIGNA